MPSQQLVEIILKAQDQASQTAKKVDDSIKNIGKSSGMLSKIPGFDSLKTKLGNVATTIDNKFGGALTRARNRISNFTSSISSVGSSIKGKFGGAIDGVRSKLSSFGNGVKNAASSMNFLKGAASMTVGMIGYDLVSSLVDSTRASLNARSSIQAFGSRLNMSAGEVSKFQADLDKLQGTFKKVDMDVVGQQAMDMAYRLGLPKESLSQLTETSAIFSDAMARNGRSAEDATLALADAMDGEFKRLKEIGISQEDLMNNGWSGDINDKKGLLDALNKSLKDQHYDELAKSVDNLDDAWQVLTITLSNLIESILVPLTPAIVGVIGGITSLIDGLKSAWSSLPDFAQLGIGIGIAAGAIVLIASVLWTTYIPAWIAAASATWAAIAPVLPIILAIGIAVGAIVAVVYEVGKAFGWWYDIDSMLAAIRTGLARLWAAFINHPDVQAAISMISSALSTLWGWIQQAGQAVLKFFGISTSNKFYLVSTLINTVGKSWEMLKGAAMTVIGVFQSIYNAAASLGSYLSDVFAPVFSFLGALWGTLVEAVQPIVTVFQQFQDGQVGLVDVITTVASSLWNVWTILSSNLSNLILTLVANLLSWAIQAGLNVLTGIATYLSQVPMRVATYLLNTLTQFISIGARWVSQARAKASQVLNGIISFLRQLPGRALSALLGVVSSIVNAGAQWVSNARSKASEVVSSVTSTLSGLPGKISGALSGVVDAITKPFKDAYDTLTGIVDNIKSKASEVANISLPTGWGGETAYGGETALPTFSSDGGTVIRHESEPIEVNVNENITLDLVNVPAHIDTATLIRMLSNRDVLRALVENRDFQSLDAKIKERIDYKVSRSRGI